MQVVALRRSYLVLPERYPRFTLVGQALGGVIFGGIAWWLALRVIASPAVGRRPAKAAQPMAPVPDG